MATVTVTLTPFRASIGSMMDSAANLLDSTLYIALLDQASSVTEDTTDSGDEFLSDLAGYNILSEIAAPSPAIVNRVLTIDDTALDELTDVGSGNTSDKILLYTRTGVDASSRLWGIGTLSSAISGDDNDDNLEVPNGILRIGPAA